jgi:hypothetical protein
VFDRKWTDDRLNLTLNDLQERKRVREREGKNENIRKRTEFPGQRICITIKIEK